jgi:hypothetical protein
MASSVSAPTRVFAASRSICAAAAVNKVIFTAEAAYRPLGGVIRNGSHLYWQRSSGATGIVGSGLKPEKCGHVDVTALYLWTKSTSGEAAAVIRGGVQVSEVVCH